MDTVLGAGTCSLGVRLKEQIELEKALRVRVVSDRIISCWRIEFYLDDCLSQFGQYSPLKPLHINIYVNPSRNIGRLAHLVRASALHESDPLRCAF